jgi:hypothetical protein
MWGNYFKENDIYNMEEEEFRGKYEKGKKNSFLKILNAWVYLMIKKRYKNW